MVFKGGLTAKRNCLMTKIIRGTDITLHDLKNKFSLRRVEEDLFFPEWKNDLPEIPLEDKKVLDKIKAGYFNLIEYPPTIEDTVKMAVLGPLLNLAGFYLPPFHIQAEASVHLSLTDEDIAIEGKIDVLVLKEQFWIMVIESKRVAFSVETGLAQILAYMMANPHPERSGFGLITNGGSFLFIKLKRDLQKAQYATSGIFELRNPGNDLYSVLGIMKRLALVLE
jgi:hypothetical protein